jgi:putative FmdB family regulatory protein
MVTGLPTPPSTSNFMGWFQLREQAMPTYEYQCLTGHQFEKLQKMSDRPRLKCPECGRMADRRISGGAGLVFKGSGFYITDYKNGKSSASADSDKDKAHTAAETSESKSSESKSTESKTSTSDSAKSTPKKADSAA